MLLPLRRKDLPIRLHLQAQAQDCLCNSDHRREIRNPPDRILSRFRFLFQPKSQNYET